MGAVTAGQQDVGIHCTAALWSCLWALELPNLWALEQFTEGISFTAELKPPLCLFQWAVSLVFYALVSLYLQFLWHLSETHLKSQDQGINTSSSSPFMGPHKDQPWSSFLCRTLTHLYLWQMPDRCQHSDFPSWEGAKVCAHSALWRVNYCFA